jgi:hypothetical protein
LSEILPTSALYHKSIKITAKLHELDYELLPHPPYSPDLTFSDLFLFADLKKMLAGKKFSTNQELTIVINYSKSAFFQVALKYFF